MPHAPPYRLPGSKILLALALIAVACMSGCAVGNFIMMAFPPDIKAVYKLKDRKTAVLVEDPDNQLGDPYLLEAMNEKIRFNLKDSGTVSDFVTAEDLKALSVKKGESFSKMPLDEICRQLGALQVVDVTVERASLNVAPSLFKPVMSVRVKVVDAEKGRLFPTPEEYNYAASDVQTLGYPVADKMSYHITTDTGRSEANRVMKLLAERVGLEVAQIFYKHAPPMPSSDVGNDLGPDPD